MYNNPYNFYPYMNQMAINGANGLGRAAGGAIRGARGGLFRSLSAIKWGSVLTNTQKTLNVINQAIPVYYQIKPIWGNLKSFGKIMSAFNEGDTTNLNQPTMQNQKNTIHQIVNNQAIKEEINSEEKKESSNNLPTFFIS